MHTPEVIDYSEKIVTPHNIIAVFQNPELDAQSKSDFLKEFIEDIKYDVIDHGHGKGGQPVLDIVFK